MNKNMILEKAAGYDVQLEGIFAELNILGLNVKEKNP